MVFGPALAFHNVSTNLAVCSFTTHAKMCTCQPPLVTKLGRLGDEDVPHVWSWCIGRERTPLVVLHSLRERRGPLRQQGHVQRDKHTYISDFGDRTRDGGRRGSCIALRPAALRAAGPHSQPRARSGRPDLARMRLSTHLGAARSRPLLGDRGGICRHSSLRADVPTIDDAALAPRSSAATRVYHSTARCYGSQEAALRFRPGQRGVGSSEPARLV